MQRVRSVLALMMIAAAVGGCDDDPAAPSEDPVDELIADIRSATDPYQAADVATAAGYAEVSPCVESPEGGMGFHYLRESLVDATVDPTEPELLLFEPEEAGDLRLVGVEYMVMAPEWDASNDSPPSILGEPFDDHRAEEARHGIPFPHYDLHVWAWEPNPSGTFAPFNPNVSCEHAG